jgi:hypothetical protein
MTPARPTEFPHGGVEWRGGRGRPTLPPGALGRRTGPGLRHHSKVGMQGDPSAPSSERGSGTKEVTAWLRAPYQRFPRVLLLGVMAGRAPAPTVATGPQATPAPASAMRGCGNRKGGADHDRRTGNPDHQAEDRGLPGRRRPRDSPERAQLPHPGHPDPGRRRQRAGLDPDRHPDRQGGQPPAGPAGKLAGHRGAAGRRRRRDGGRRRPAAGHHLPHPRVLPGDEPDPRRSQPQLLLRAGQHRASGSSSRWRCCSTGTCPDAGGCCWRRWWCCTSSG